MRTCLAKYQTSVFQESWPMITRIQSTKLRYEKFGFPHHLTMANASYLKIFSFTFSLHLVGRKIPDSVSNYLPSCLSKFDSLSFTFNFVLSKLSMLSCVFVLNLLRKRQHLIELKLLDSLRCNCFYLLNIWLTM